jgi:predicted transcriptional regulator
VQYTWKDFWFFNNWKTEIGFKFDHYYDISEFTIYAILPTLFLFGKRYLSGNLFINKKGISDENDSNLNFDTKINQLKKIKELYDLGVITEMEFEDLKKKLLNR